MVAIRFNLKDDLDAVRELLRRYADRPVSFADACLVRMTEAIPGSSIPTLDGDFRIYRRHGRQTIPVIIAPR